MELRGCLNQEDEVVLANQIFPQVLNSFKNEFKD
jgi:hypothetical protein